MAQNAKAPAASQEDPSSNTPRAAGQPPGEPVMPAPPDGGWGWVILAASFLCNSTVDGTCSVFGLILPDLLEYYGESRAKTTLAASLMLGMFLLSGPLVSAVLNTFGCRKTTMAGGLLATAALVISTHAPNLDVFIPVYGGLGGLGLGLIYLPATVMVGFYFEKKRAVATGVATSGAGAGLVIYSIITAAILQHWSWRQTLTLISGITLQSVVLGALMRPLEPQLPPLTLDDLETTRLMEGEKHSELQLNDSSQQTSSFEDEKITNLDNSSHQSSKVRGYSKQHKPSPLLLKNLHLTAEQTSHSCGELPSKSSDSFTDVRPAAKTRLSRYHHVSPVSISWHNIHSSGDNVSHQPSPLTNTHLSNPMLRKDIFYSGSIQDLPEYKEQPDRDHYMAEYTSYPKDKDQHDKKCCRKLSCGFDRALFTNCAFWVILLANFLLHIGQQIPNVFMVDYAIVVGIPHQTASTLITAMGVSNAVGRAGSGAIGNLPGVNCLTFSAVSLLILATATYLAPVFCKAYVSLLVYAIVYGVFGVFVPLTTVLIVQYIGLDKLTSAYGVLSTAKGLGCLLGPPIAGGILDVTSSYQISFFFAASLFAVSGLVFFLVPVAHKLQHRAQHT